MSNHLLMRPKRGLLVTAALCAMLALSACGSSDDDDTPTTPPPPAGGTPPPVASGDSFFAYVMNIAANLVDGNEPEAIEGLVETKPENTEPQPVG